MIGINPKFGIKGGLTSSWDFTITYQLCPLANYLIVGPLFIAFPAPPLYK